MSRFINPFTDIGFKRIFGQEFSKPLLLDFLNNLLKGERHIASITQYDSALKKYRDTMVVLKGAELKGQRDKALDAALVMKADGMPLDKISKYVGLPIPEIEKL